MPGIILIGYRGTGKSAVGQILADQLGCALIDTDRLVETRAKKTIAQLFSEEGETAFRDRETDILTELAARDDFFVLATGGGVPIREVNRRLLRRVAGGPDSPRPGRIVWLTAESATIATRLARDEKSETSRPALTKLSPTEEIDALLAERAPFYREIADRIVATDNRTPSEIVAEIIA